MRESVNERGREIDNRDDLKMIRYPVSRGRYL